MEKEKKKKPQIYQNSTIKENGSGSQLLEN